MKLFTLFLALFAFVNLSWSQKHPEFYKRQFVIFEGCDDANDKVECYDVKLQELIGKQLNNKVFKDSIFIKAKKDTISVSTSILYDEKGVIVKEYSHIVNYAIETEENKFNLILDSIAKVKPVLDTYNNGVASTVTNLFGYLLDRSKDSIVPILGFEPTEVPFAIIEKVPVYKGCDENLSNKELVSCMNSKVAELISKKFNIKLASKLGLPNGVVRIFINFKIDKDGKVTDINARGPHKKLEEEAVRIISKIPKLKSPGFYRKKPVIMPFSIPIVFRITD